MPNDLQRFTTDDGRVYTDMEDLFLPSVTTVIDQKSEPEGVKKWKDRNDGTGDTDHWEDILEYKGNRGTLVHYELLNELVSGDMHGEEEQRSGDSLKANGNWSRYEDDLEYAKSAWEEITEQQGIRSDNIVEVECFVTNTNLGYAGQFDLLYVDDDGNLVLSDLKTSKYVYDKHMMQLVAYDRALNVDIDAMEVVRIHPDTESWEIARDGEDWFDRRFIDYDSTDEIWNEFASLREGMGDIQAELEQMAEDGRTG